MSLCPSVVKARFLGREGGELKCTQPKLAKYTEVDWQLHVPAAYPHAISHLYPLDCSAWWCIEIICLCRESNHGPSHCATALCPGNSTAQPVAVTSAVHHDLLSDIVTILRAMTVFLCSLYQSRQFSNKRDCFVKFTNRWKCVIIRGRFDMVVDILYNVDKNALCVVNVCSCACLWCSTSC